MTLVNSTKVFAHCKTKFQIKRILNKSVHMQRKKKSPHYTLKSDDTICPIPSKELLKMSSVAKCD